MDGKSFAEKWRYIQTYRWSSLKGYLDEKDKLDYIDYMEILGYFGLDETKTRKGYRSFVEEGVEKGIENPFKKVQGQLILGTDRFVDWVKETFFKENVSEREHPGLRRLRKRYTPDEVIQIISKVTGKKRNVLIAKNNRGIERAILIEMLYRYGRLRQSEIGEIMGRIDYSAISQARKRLQQKLKADNEMYTFFREIEGIFNSKKSNVEI
jgi:hypothetical protein